MQRTCNFWSVIRTSDRSPTNFLSSRKDWRLFPVDCTLPTQSCQSTSIQMISGIQIPPGDIRRCLFPSLSVQVGANKLDVFNAMASSLYSEVNVGIHDDNSPTMPEMALHLRLKLAAFYHRCACFPFISETMVEWSILVVEESHACTGVCTPLLPCAVKRLYLFSLSSLIMYSPGPWSELYTKIGLFLPTPVSFFDSHAPPLCAYSVNNDPFPMTLMTLIIHQSTGILLALTSQ
jgi:hypothetical protein